MQKSNWVAPTYLEMWVRQRVCDRSGWDSVPSKLNWGCHVCTVNVGWDVELGCATGAVGRPISIAPSRLQWQIELRARRWTVNMRERIGLWQRAWVAPRCLEARMVRTWFWQIVLSRVHRRFGTEQIAPFNWIIVHHDFEIVDTIVIPTRPLRCHLNL